MSTFREGQSTARSVVSWALALVSLHHLGFVAGALLVVDGIIGLMVGPGMGLDTIQWVQELAIVCFGVILVLVESSERATLPFCGVSILRCIPRHCRRGDHEATSNFVSLCKVRFRSIWPWSLLRVLLNITFCSVPR